MIKVESIYKNEKKEILTERAKVQVGGEKEEFLPYELLFGALSSCFYYTLQDILRKKKIDVEEVRIRVEGTKRTEVPTTLEKATLHVTYVGDIDEKDAEQSAKLAGKYCSIHHTLSLVADIRHEIVIEKEKQ
ncbi:MAG TPA: OsmC family protein [Tissierellia bacterium]|jgi:putative redox protein|nr:OsmC family protein [Tissierellia bacterium]